ncbi:hypothetical protein, conserved [Trypanosoma brucei brucei TREU927]|uniref:RING-type E3 ubiquitin transferase n=1 Tax=Trypanosoma brucei brucei (strain 927/4 GUTat10.1) TaxID=185431 RepID=Q57YW7_TRYB2|nr:hypothetical protein, conserved [Trypanosoma brucei brucei TREU927]AAX79665.1 hypothetical protein, conserved [Trypanosoma brucei]AAZ13111.1 hypothetical protein, conserved [Trypanosoma brucei brucei TREU927]
MDGRNGSKRARSEPANGPNQSNVGTSGVEEPHVEEVPARDPELERQLDRLNIDDNLKESLRGLSPSTRGEVMNDIIRSETIERASSLMEQANLLSLIELRRLPELMEEGMSSQHYRADVDDDSELHEFGQALEDMQADGQSPSPQRGRPHGMLHTPGPLILEFLRAFAAGTHAAFADAAGVSEHLNILSELAAQRAMGVTEDVDNMSYEELLELEDKIGYVSRGVKPEDVQKCVKDVPTPHEGNCVVCQCEWSDNAETAPAVVELNRCKHVFHRTCIREWLLKNKKCPVCTQEVV